MQSRPRGIFRPGNFTGWDSEVVKAARPEACTLLPTTKEVSFPATSVYSLAFPAMPHQNDKGKRPRNQLPPPPQPPPPTPRPPPKKGRGMGGGGGGSIFICSRNQHGPVYLSGACANNLSLIGCSVWCERSKRGLFSVPGGVYVGRSVWPLLPLHHPRSIAAYTAGSAGSSLH